MDGARELSFSEGSLDMRAGTNSLAPYGVADRDAVGAAFSIAHGPGCWRVVEEGRCGM